MTWDKIKRNKRVYNIMLKKRKDGDKNKIIKLLGQYVIA
jgi:hypothetical protein